MTLYFVNESGEYTLDNLLSPVTPVSITLDGRPFNMYAIDRTLEEGPGRKIVKVDFIDETLKLENYYVALTGQGCGPRVYNLGAPVDKRTPQQKFDEENDPRLNNEFSLQIKKLTRFEDIEYHFSEFVDVLKTIFTVEVTAQYDPTVTRGFPGSFKEVLNAWCAYFNIAYYFENNVLKIVDPQGLNLIFPDVPADALDKTDRESLDGTFTKTAFAYFRQEGGEKEVAGSLIDKTVTMYPLGADLSIPQPQIDPNQLAAAQYGQEYWFLYNWLNGTATEECGWEWIDIGELPHQFSITTTVAVIAATQGVLASLDRDKFDQRYQFYKEYGTRIAGRYYISRPRSSIIEDKQCDWFRVVNSDPSPYSSRKNPLDMGFFQQGTTDGGIVPGSQINQYYVGIALNDNRLVYYDQREIDFITPFKLTTTQQANIAKAFNSLISGSLGSTVLDYTQISTVKDYFVAVRPNASDLQKAIPTISTEQLSLFGYIYRPDFDVKGVLPQTIRSIYYAKIEECRFRSSVDQADQALRHILVPRQVSEDVPVVFTVTSPTPNSFVLVRDMSFVDLYLNTQILDKLALPQLQKLRTLSFTLNYLSPDILLTDFVTMGLTGLNIDLQDHGMTVTYTFSNAVQKVPVSEAFLDKLEMNIKNSWVSKYNPPDRVN